MTVEYINLSNGIACHSDATRYMRLQSTWCEQKRWEDILWTTPADLFMNAAVGKTIIVHDQSERGRLTRAQWQGLSWIRFACRCAWALPEEREVGRSGNDLATYWRRMWAVLPDRVRGYVRYYSAVAAGPQVVIRPCSCARVAAHISVLPSQPVATPAVPTAKHRACPAVTR